MGSLPAEAAATALEDLPEDALLAILSLLPPPDAAAAACACRRLAASTSSPALPLALALSLGVPPPLPRGPLLPSSSSSLSCPTAARRLPPRAGPARRRRHQAPLRDALHRRVRRHGGVRICRGLAGPRQLRREQPHRGGFCTLGRGGRARGGERVAAGGSVCALRQQAEPRCRRRRWGRQGKRGAVGGMEPQHFVRIAEAEPTKARPLQGLWKGICENRTLEFYLAVYDDIGGVMCRRFSDNRGHNSGYSPVFWTTDTTFLEPPFSEQEVDDYSSRDHIRDVASNHTETENRIVSRILCMRSSYDAVDPHLSTPLDDARNVEGISRWNLWVWICW